MEENSKTKMQIKKISRIKAYKRWFDIYDFAQIIIIIFHILINPYTKVEEEFMTNNIYDLLKFGFKFSNEW